MAVATLAGGDDEGWEASVYHDLSHGCVLRMRIWQENWSCCEMGDHCTGAARYLGSPKLRKGCGNVAWPDTPKTLNKPTFT